MDLERTGGPRRMVASAKSQVPIPCSFQREGPLPCPQSPEPLTQPVTYYDLPLDDCRAILELWAAAGTQDPRPPRGAFFGRRWWNARCFAPPWKRLKWGMLKRSWRLPEPGIR